MDTVLLKLLENARFTNKEARIYLALLELGMGNAGQVARITDLKRPIVYVVLEGLIARGYVSQLPDRKINTFQAVDPVVILNKLRAVTKNFSEMIPVFRSLHNKGKNRPKISYHETKEGIRNVYEEMSRAKTPFFISNYFLIEKFFPKAVENWVLEVDRGLYSPKGRHLIPENNENIKIAKDFLKINQQVRVSKDLKKMSMDFSIWDNKLAITSFEDQPFAVMMESQTLVDSILPLFELAWERGVRIEGE